MLDLSILQHMYTFHVSTAIASESNYIFKVKVYDKFELKAIFDIIWVPFRCHFVI